MQFTRFIRKAFATTILLSGKFSLFLTLPTGSPGVITSPRAAQASIKNHLGAGWTQRHSQRLVQRGACLGRRQFDRVAQNICFTNLKTFPRHYFSGDIWSAKGHPSLLRPGKLPPQKGGSSRTSPPQNYFPYYSLANFLCLSFVGYTPLLHERF